MSQPTEFGRTWRIFVTGGTGALGRRVLPLLVEAGHQVTAVGRTAEKRGLLSRLGVRPAETDLFNPASVRRSLEDAEVVINLATAVPPGMRALWRRSWRAMDRVRTEVSGNLAAAALAGGRVTRLIQESFAPIYPDSGDSWVDESVPTRPARYNRSILAAESNATRFAAEGRVAVVLRFGFFYGPGDPGTAIVLDSIRRGWYPFFGRPEAYTSWLHLADAAAAVMAALEVPNGIYNVVEDEPLRRVELAEGVARVLGVKPPRFLPAWSTRLGGSVAETLARSLRISNRKFRWESGWAPRHASALEGMTDLLRDEAPVAAGPAPARS